MLLFIGFCATSFNDNTVLATCVENGLGGTSCYDSTWGDGGNSGNDSGNNGGGGNNGNGGSGGSWNTCVNYCTSFGATWQFYEWDGNTEIRTNADPSSGRKEGDETPFAHNYTFSSEMVSVCSKTQGYWRYAYVRMSDGKQNGVARTNGNSSKWVDSVYFGGQTTYNTAVGQPWETAHTAFLEMFPGREDLWNQGVSVFCGYGDPPTPTYHTCSSALEPAAYTASNANKGWSSVRTQVTNGNGGWSNLVYAKPDDYVQWEHCYFPGVQRTANTSVTISHPHPTEIANTNDRIKPYKNSALVNAISGWGNSFTIKDRYGGTSSESYNNGDDNVEKVSHSDQVDPSWVGKSYSETSSLGSTPWYTKVWNMDNHTWDCTYEVESTCEELKEKDFHCEKGTVSGVSGGQLQYNEIVTECNPSVHAGPNSCNCRRMTKVEVSCMKTQDQVCSHGDDAKLYGYEYASDDEHLNGGLSSETATVNVPYNFTMSGTIALKGNYVYAGEEADLDHITVTVGDRTNKETGGTYSTKAENVKAQILSFVSSAPTTSIPNSARLGGEIEIGNMDAGETRTATKLGIKSVNVDDVTAGNYFCVAIQVSPASSGGDTTMNPSGFDYSYRKSGVDCKPIAKRPTIQIWGGSLFSNSNITTSRAEKNNLNGFADRSYKISGVSDANVFGSWDEQSTMVLGINTGFGSGAATANRLNKTGSAQQGRFESNTNGGFCKYESPLTFANFTKKMAIPICGANNNQSGKFGTTAVSVDKESYITSVVDTKPTSGFVGTTPFVIGSSINGTPTYSVVKSGTGKEILYTMGQNGKDVQLSASVIGKGKTYIIYSYKDVIIQGDITYENITPEAGEEIKSDDIPKLIIYAKNSIRIDCGVKRVDAVLIGEKEIDDCRGYGNDVNASQLSNQLVINGTIITDKAYMKRTYGAGTGKYSGIPAEIINYDSTLVIWARSRADTGETGVLNATYTHELAPRY